MTQTPSPLRLLADENFNNRLIKGLLRRNPQADILRVQDLPGLYQADDPTVLEWAAQNGQVVLTHDVQTMPGYARQRLREGLPMAGLFIVGKTSSMAAVIEDLWVLTLCSQPGEWQGCELYLPLHSSS